ncbi:hypothetical protein CP061683_1045B, partial [Chlamydia psittaci 06-1683]
NEVITGTSCPLCMAIS